METNRKVNSYGKNTTPVRYYSVLSFKWKTWTINQLKGGKNCIVLKYYSNMTWIRRVDEYWTGNKE